MGLLSLAGDGLTGGSGGDYSGFLSPFLGSLLPPPQAMPTGAPQTPTAGLLGPSAPGTPDAAAPSPSGGLFGVSGLSYKNPGTPDPSAGAQPIPIMQPGPTPFAFGGQGQPAPGQLQPITGMGGARYV